MGVTYVFKLDYYIIDTVTSSTMCLSRGLPMATEESSDLVGLLSLHFVLDSHMNVDQNAG